MTSTKLYLSLLFIPLFNFGQPMILPDRGNLTVEVQNIIPQKGKVGVFLYSEKGTFLKSRGICAKKFTEANNYKVSITFENLPHGTYAVTSYQDINNNGKIDKNIIGIPKEPVGILNRNKKRLQKPKFKKSKINFFGNAQYIKLKLFEY